MLIIGLTTASISQPVLKEYQVKAGFLYNFTQFVEWSPEAFADKDSPFILGILGEDPFGDFIDATVEGEEIMGHPIVVRRFTDAKEISECHILFLNSATISRKTITELHKKNILTVTDVNNMGRSESAIRFYTENGKIRLQINLSAVREANLTISSKLLKLAKITKK